MKLFFKHFLKIKTNITTEHGETKAGMNSGLTHVSLATSSSAEQEQEGGSQRTHGGARHKPAAPALRGGRLRKLGTISDFIHLREDNKLRSTHFNLMSH